MHVAINTLSHVTGGGITYFENVLPRLEDDGNTYSVLVPAGRDKITRTEADNVQFVETSFPVGFLLGRLLYEQLVFPILLWYWNVDVLLSPADLTPLLAPCPAVLAIRNPNPYFDAPELERSGYRQVKFRLQRYLTWLSARKAKEVFFVSAFSKDIATDVLSLPDAKTHVVYHGIDAELFRTPARPTPALDQTIEANQPYILTVSTINEHKNYEALLRGFARVPTAIREEYDLLVAGRNSAPSYFETLQDICHSEGITEDVTFLGEVDYQNVPALYASASCYVLPSKLETFGHTLVESMASGCPIVAANATCIPEITDGAAELFDPDDPDDLAQALERVLTDASRRDELCKRGRERVSDFSWDTTVNQTKALLRSATEEESRRQ